MPQLGMGLQSLVSNWVKVNNKHIVFPGGNGEGGGGSNHGENDPSAILNRHSPNALSSSDQQSGGGNGADTISGSSSKRNLSHSDSASTLPPAPKPVVGDGRTMLQQRHAPFPTSPALRSRPGPPANLPSSSMQPPQRPRQGKRIWGKGDRRLSRSNSQSDLVRSMASQRMRQRQEGGPSDPPQQQHHPNRPLHHPPQQPLPEAQKTNGNGEKLKQTDEEVGVGKSKGTPAYHNDAITPEGADASLRCAAGFLYGESDGGDYVRSGTKQQQMPPFPHSRTNNAGILGAQPPASTLVGAHQNDHSNPPSQYYHRPPYPPDTTDHYRNEAAFVRQAEISGRRQQTAAAIPEELNLQNSRAPHKKDKSLKQHSTRQKAASPNGGATTAVPQQPPPMSLGKPQQPFPHPVNSYKMVPGQQPRTGIPPTMVGEFGGSMQQNVPMNEHHQHIPYDPHYGTHHQQPLPYNHRNQPPAAKVSPMLGPIPSTCPNCTEMEKYIFAVEADLEYLRSVALRNEFVCSRCESDDKSISSRQSKKSQNKVVSCASVGSRKKRDRGTHQRCAAESMGLAEASQRLVDVTARHKRQIEQMTKERARWQNDMHLKLSKFAMMCKDLNEESAKRKDEANVAQSELVSARIDRDSLSSEVEILRARVELYEKCELENASLREMIRSQDNETLTWADEEVKKRDDVIVDLSCRLEQTLDTLEIERQQQRIRRQIIFPVGRSSSMGYAETDPSPTEGGNNIRSSSMSASIRDMNEQLVKAKEEARVAEAALMGVKTEAAKREEALLERCKKLERQLQSNGESSGDGWWDERRQN